VCSDAVFARARRECRPAVSLAQASRAAISVLTGPWCLRLDRAVEDTHLGELFFSIMALELRDVAEQIYFTLPESLWLRKGPFFESFGFTTATIAEVQYRLFDQELRCNASYGSVWDAALLKLPKLSKFFSSGGFSSDNPTVMSVNSNRAEQIMARTKTVEIRKRFSKHWKGEKINVYATAPLMSLVGEARNWFSYRGQSGGDLAKILESDRLLPFRI
jgi:hypothetical protein